MRRLHSYNYKIRTLLILVPFMLLANATWALNKSFTPDIPDEIRAHLLLTSRICFPGLFAVCIAFLVPTVNRFLQISSVGASYLLLIHFCPLYMPSILYAPIVCVIASSTALFAFLPASNDYDYSRYQTSRMFLSLIYAIMLPVITTAALILIIRQIDSYVLFTFHDVFGHDLLSVVYVPLYIILQAFGVQEIVSNLLAISEHKNLVNAFVNAIIVTNLISLPATIFVRALFSKNHMYLFLTLFSCITLLTSSNGACVSLAWLILLLVFPGMFAILLLTCSLCFALSYFQVLWPITTIDNLYNPDVNLAKATLFYASKLSGLELLAFVLPCALVVFVMQMKRHNANRDHNKKRNVNYGYTINQFSSPELKVVALLRSFGGISNIADIEADNNWLYVQVVDRSIVSTTMLHTMIHSKLLVDRVNKLYLCDIGMRSQFYCKRITDLMENHFGEEEYEVPISSPVPLETLIQREGLDKPSV